MTEICLLVAGVLRVALPTPEFELAWEHSVEKTRWEERYRADGDLLQLVDARVQAMGAGMEPPTGAVMKDGWWRWYGGTNELPELRLTYSTFTADYRFCWNRHCRDLAAVLGQRPDDGDVITVRVCNASEADRARK